MRLPDDLLLASGAILLAFLVLSIVPQRLAYHVTLERGGSETLSGPLAYRDCQRQVEQATFTDNHIHYCRLNKENNDER